MSALHSEERGGVSRITVRPIRRPAVAHVALDFFDRYLKNDQGALERLRHDADQPGVATLQEQVR
jgi:hypothetical protein